MTISEVAKMYDMPMDTIRYYEKIGLMELVERDSIGRRNFQEKDLRRLRFLKLMRSSGVSIQRLKEYVNLFRIGEDTLTERKEILICQRKEIRYKINELQNVLAELDYNIENFDKTLAKWERMRRYPEKYSEADVIKVEKERSIDLHKFMDKYNK